MLWLVNKMLRLVMGIAIAGTSSMLGAPASRGELGDGCVAGAGQRQRGAGGLPAERSDAVFQLLDSVCSGAGSVTSLAQQLEALGAFGGRGPDSAVALYSRRWGLDTPGAA
jgi:hypothetical protein